MRTLDAGRKRLIARYGTSISLRAFGLAGIAEEAIIQHGERPTLLLIFASMAGLPTFLSVDKTATKPPAANGAPPATPKEVT